jgi:hypothetical protein
LCLKNIRFFVLDEADALLAGGTLNAIHTFKQKIPKHGSIVAQKFGRVQVRVSFPKSGDTVLPKLVTVQTEAGDCLPIHRPIHAMYSTPVPLTSPNNGLTLFFIYRKKPNSLRTAG